MKAHTIFLASAILVSLVSAGIEATIFTIQNNCDATIWPASLTSANSPQLGNTGFSLDPGASKTILAPAGWQGRFWARTFCYTYSSGEFSCLTGDCSSGQLGQVTCNGSVWSQPVTLVEFSLNRGSDRDVYDISLVDGFNLPVTITPPVGCLTTSCSKDLKDVCPSELSNYGWNGIVIGCRSACFAFDTDADCCRGSHSSPQTCQPSNYTQLFKSQCPHAYSYVYDSSSSSFTCPSGGDYTITFCGPVSNFLGSLCYN